MRRGRRCKGERNKAKGVSCAYLLAISLCLLTFWTCGQEPGKLPGRVDPIELGTFPLTPTPYIAHDRAAIAPVAEEYFTIPDSCTGYYQGGVYDPFRRYVIPAGDYDGDGTRDSLIGYLDLPGDTTGSYLLSRHYHRLHHYQVQHWASVTRPELELRVVGGTVSNLRLENLIYVAGLTYARNVGNVDGIRGDELVLEMYTPDLSNTTTGWVFTYRRGWKVLRSFSSWHWELECENPVPVRSAGAGKLTLRARNYEAVLHDTVVSLLPPVEEGYQFRIR